MLTVEQFINAAGLSRVSARLFAEGRYDEVVRQIDSMLMVSEYERRRMTAYVRSLERPASARLEPLVGVA